MDIVTLTDITGTIGEWLDAEFDDELPDELIRLLYKAYDIAVKELDENKYHTPKKGQQQAFSKPVTLRPVIRATPKCVRHCTLLGRTFDNAILQGGFNYERNCKNLV